MNNKTLGIAFGALLAIYLLLKLFSGNKERSFDPEVISVDTASVNEIIIHPPEGTAFSLKRTSSDWTVEQDGKQFEATRSSVTNLLANVLSIKAERVVSKNPDRWADYSVNDSLATRIQLLDGSKSLGDIMVGRFNFNQATRSGVSYFRATEEDEVYSAEGFLSMSLSQKFDNFRDKTLVSFAKDDVTRITLQDERGERAYSKIDNHWQDQTGNPIDSAEMVKYINTLSSVSGQDFADVNTDVGARLKTLMIEGNNMSGPIEVNLYQSLDAEEMFVLHSSLNQEGYFFCDSIGPFDRIFNKFDDPLNAGE